MKVHYLLLPLLILSCNNKKETTEINAAETEDQCFILNHGINFDEPKKTVEPLTHDQILKNVPAHITLNNLSDYEEFSYDQIKTSELKTAENKFFSSSEYKDKFSAWISALPEFQYLSLQEEYALAKNKYGLWLIENIGGHFKPYFLGFTQNFYLPSFYGKDQQFIENDQFVINGTVVDVQRLSRIPMLPKYEVIKDGLQFRIDLHAIKKDADLDGFNDLFENFIGLNADSADSDGDGISDFKDTNPKYKVGTNKFTSMYESLVDHGNTKSTYSFVEILTDCEYFQAINPKNMKVLLYKTTEKAPLKEDVLDQFFPRKYSKMKTYKNYDEVYFTDFSDESGDGTISAELVNGKWKFDKKYTVTFGM